MADQAGPFQIIYSGKAPSEGRRRQDDYSADFRIIGEVAQKCFKIVYLENYDMDLARTLCASVDVWLNTPERPLEASGTASGMKAALNGVPSLSVLDGWWIEGHVEGASRGGRSATTVIAKLMPRSKPMRFTISSSTRFCRCITASPMPSRKSDARRSL